MEFWLISPSSGLSAQRVTLRTAIEAGHHKPTAATQFLGSTISNSPLERPTKIAETNPTGKNRTAQIIVPAIANFHLLRVNVHQRPYAANSRGVFKTTGMNNPIDPAVS